mgnify:CR=1 FL=1
MTEAALEPARTTSHWREEYEQGLRADWGWLTVTGLHWLEDGVHLIGSSPAAAVRLAAGVAGTGSEVPHELARITVDGGSAGLDAVSPALHIDGVPVRPGKVALDSLGRSDRMIAGNQSMIVVARRGRIGVRTFNNDSALRYGFRGCRWFPVDDGWRVPARFEPFPEPRRISFMTVLGDESSVIARGRYAFEVDGRTHSLVPTGRGSRPFFVFRDATSGIQTYGASRFLTADPPVDGVTWLDFNRAHNPPCAFTPYATCPLPPAGNVLDLAVTAGELTFDAG